MDGNPTVNPHEQERLTTGVTAWKLARLQRTRDGVVRLMGASSDAAYEVQDLATCTRVRTHVPPHPGCRCGFHGWRDRPSARRHLWGSHPVLLAVELFGRLDEYQYGWVAAGQRVLDAALVPVCAPCLDGHRIVLAEQLATTRPALLAPACARHAVGADSTVRLVAAAEALEVPLRWLPIDDVLRAHLEIGVRLFDPPVRHRLGRLSDLGPGEAGHVFQQSLARDHDGYWIAPEATLVQPMPGIDVPVRRNGRGRFEALVEGIGVRGWWRRRDPAVHRVPVRLLGDAALS